MIALQVSSLQGGYGRLTVFREVNLEVERGQTLGLLGANGAGKTTLMKTLAGALPAATGSVRLRGKTYRGCRPTSGRAADSRWSPKAAMC
jgi:ABC-type branched-subunit amino acid transport system ATPase component